MTKLIVRTDNVDGFFERTRAAARRADRRQSFERTVTLSFEDPANMFAVLSDARCRLISEVMTEAKSINELSVRLQRNRSAITKDVGLLEKMGLVVSRRESNPEHGIPKVVRSVARKIELVAKLV